MKKREVRVETLNGQTRMLVLEDGAPVEFAIENSARQRLVGSVYLARVVNILRGMQAAFVDIGFEKNAFLSLDDLPPVAREADEIRVDFKRAALRPGQEIIVQVLKEPGGDKGPRVTMTPTFPGKYVVLLPTMEATGVSRRIQGEEERRRLYEVAKSACPEGMGLIIRTAAEGVQDAEIREDAAALESAWRDIERTAHAEKAPAPLFDDGSLLGRAGRDLNAEIIAGPIDDVLAAKLDKLLQRKVWLDSGAFLVIDRCEAMTVIDVNSGKYVGKKSLDDTLLHLNCEAAREIARQIRLRDMGGIVVVDFVDMAQEEDRQSVLDVFMIALAPDRARYHVHGFTAAGLLEMTRRPVYQPVEEALRAPCPHCHGEGTVLAPSEAAYRLSRDIRRRRLAGDESEITVRAAPELIEAMHRTGSWEGVRFIEESTQGGTP